MKKGDWLMMLERHMVLTLALEKRITQRHAAQELGLSLCHTKRLLRRLKQTKGDPHSLDYHRTHPAPNRTPEEVREQVVALKVQLHIHPGRKIRVWHNGQLLCELPHREPKPKSLASFDDPRPGGIILPAR